MANLANMQLVSDPVRRGAGEAPKGPIKHLGVAAAMRSQVTNGEGDRLSAQSHEIGSIR